ncbi:glycosyltransferase family 2 protein [Paenibacillus dendritiformis]|uniref:glycosyltransferase family 2 protein n=1 Tax=Paenibacillus dendritiformis TaxID=130049 RepID=UPI00248B4495|nr:glycosyltransferase family 2 protein [Paenibacillus dendritiformis]WGU94667.1 glycosyltransferase family 2 protein [Paenibacillus dendritiformis]
MLRSTIISHFFNEEYLLPWWLQHHVPLFDHGILLNRGSTDRSVDICRQFAPHWEVRDSTVHEFDAVLVDREVMEIERECTGWKTVLNTTEFLCFRDKQQFYTTLEALGNDMYFIRSIYMVDDPKYGYPDPHPAVPLVRQRHHGFISPVMGRFIHKFPHGNYWTGRHYSLHPYSEFPCVNYPAPAFILKFDFSPWTEQLRLRKLQIGPTMSQESIKLGMGHQHVVTRDELEHRYLQLVTQTTDLRIYPEYMRLWG